MLEVAIAAATWIHSVPRQWWPLSLPMTRKCKLIIVLFFHMHFEVKFAFIYRLCAAADDMVIPLSKLRPTPNTDSNWLQIAQCSPSTEFFQWRLLPLNANWAVLCWWDSAAGDRPPMSTRTNFDYTNRKSLRIECKHIKALATVTGSRWPTI